MSQTDPHEQRVLVLAPTGRDAPLIAGALERHGFASTICRDLSCVCREMAAGAGMAVLTEEGLLPDGLSRLVKALRQQPPWSDFPLLILTGKGVPSQASVQRFQALEPIANVTQQERPVRIRTLISAARAALRGRQRQYEMRDHLTERESLLAELRHRAEKLAETDQRKDEFLATLAHELRNPLAPVRNALQILHLAGDNRLAAEQARSMMDRQVQQMVRLVDDLLDVSRITRGTVELKKERVALSTIIATAVETSRPLIEVARHHLSVTLPPETIELEADPTRLAQVLSNLLNNAAKYTEAGGRIWLMAAREGNRVAVRVRDSGVGIAAEMLPRIFDLFMQVDRSIDKSQGGLGVGLTLVRTLLDMHGGTVEVRSEGLGQGSEFSISLPLAPERPPTQADGRRQPNSASSLPLRRVLVVDDNVDAAQSLAMLLRILGQDVRTAHNGQSALEAARAAMPEIAILDIGLPGMDGHELARRLRKEPGGDALLIIALTGWGRTRTACARPMQASTITSRSLRTRRRSGSFSARFVEIECRQLILDSAIINRTAVFLLPLAQFRQQLFLFVAFFACRGWQLIPVGDHWYRIANESRGLCLEVPKGLMERAKIEQAKVGDGFQQHWRPSAGSSGAGFAA